MATYEKRCSGTIKKTKKWFGERNLCTSCEHSFGDENMLGKRCTNKIKHVDGREWVYGTWDK